MANSRAWNFAKLLNSDGKVKADKTELRDGAAFTGNVDFNQGADVTGDITVTGNVDGVDVSAFKSDYDSHNHDDRYYTETEADSRFVNVTGDTITGNLSVSGSLTSGSNAVFHDGYHPNADKWTTARTLTLSGDASGSVSWDGSANATLSVTVANDSHTHDTRYVKKAGDTLTGTLNYRMLQNQSSSNLDTAGDSSGFSVFYGTSSATSKPSGTDHAVATFSYSNAWQTQMAMDWRTKNMYFRTQENGTWKSWSKMWHDGNDGSGSGLDADLLDGVHGSSFLRSDTVDTIASTNIGPILTVNKTGSAPGNRTAFKAVNEYGNHSWGIVGEFRVDGVSGSDRASILFSNGYNSNTWSVGFGSTDDNFRIKTDHGHINQGWGYDRMLLDRSGNVTFSGNVTAYSDERLKENIVTIDNALDKVNAIRGVTYNRNDIEDTSRHAGVIAQEVEKVLPEVVQTDKEGTKTVAYGNMVGLLIEAIKEQQAQIDELKAKLEV